VNYFEGRTILLTGGTGSFGHHFTRTALSRWNPKTIRIFSRDELKQSEMQRSFGDDRLRFLIGDVRDHQRLRRAVDGVDIVIHAAAMKQVPACEYNPFEAVQTNILGTQNVAEACIEAGISRAVALSTDKAVSPASLYGATKLCAEKLFVQANVYAGPKDVRLSCVRYGNVVGSRGSVVPLFRQQADNGELTVTDERMTRFWITLTQGVNFVLSSMEMMRGGEIFVPKIPSTTIVDLASLLGPNLAQHNVGVRPGEKLHETMIPADDSRWTVETEDRYVILASFAAAAREAYLNRGGKPVAEGFQYSSDSNPERLDARGLQSLLAHAFA
jgi:UDP-N-acetylglucosamine 4,6-dehydratase